MNIFDLFHAGGLDYVFTSPLLLVGLVFQVWMIVHAIRHREWGWVVFMVIFSVFAAFWYYLQVHRASPSTMHGFELPGAQNRRRIKELQAQIHHLDKPHHHLQLGDIYFQRGKLTLAETSYRAALERDSQDLDARAHLGQCLLRQKRALEARPFLESVCAENPKHDYGHSLMALAETQAELGEAGTAMATWKRVTDSHSYARARVQLAELYLARQQSEPARSLLQEVLTDAPHGPTFERKRERIWVRRAHKLTRHLPPPPRA